MIKLFIVCMKKSELSYRFSRKAGHWFLMDLIVSRYLESSKIIGKFQESWCLPYAGFFFLNMSTNISQVLNESVIFHIIWKD